MSYSFGTRKTNKADALADVAAKMDEVTSQQENHKLDSAQALRAVESFVNLLPDDPTKDVVVSVSGSLTIDGYGTNELQTTGVSMSVTAYLAKREAQPVYTAPT